MLYKTSSLLAPILTYAIILYLGVVFNTNEVKSSPEAEILTNLISVEQITDKIIRLSKEYNFNTKTALKVAECESQFGKYQINWEGSSAKGIYQFTDRTWNAYCEGDVMNADDNIKCFLKLYNKNPSWWACQQ